MSETLPSILVTGASGFVGRHFLEAMKDGFLIYGLCRRSQREAGVSEHPNIKWIQLDIANWPALKATLNRIKELGGADYVLHLAGYYDFSYEDHPEYDRTNVNGTRHVLEFAKSLSVKRMIFSSSLAACGFPPPGSVVTEESPADADFAYARSKRRGEEMMKEYSRWMPCSTVRLAAVFSDWCEYPPLYVFLSTWLSRRWNSRILGGGGESAVSYIHVNDLCNLFLTILRKTQALPAYGVYNASPNGSTSHRRLFETATRYYAGRAADPVFVPKMIACPGVLLRDWIGRLRGRRPFERPWMMKYVDLKLEVDSSHTRRVLGWEPTPRYHILRRLLFLIEKMKSNPGEWEIKNETALKRIVERPSLRMYEALVELREKLVGEIVDHMLSPEKISDLPHYRRMKREELEWYIGLVYRLLMAAVRTGDRALMLEYANDLAGRRFEEGMPPREIREVLQTMNRVIVSALSEWPGMEEFQQQVHDAVTLSFQLGMDEIEDCYARFEAKQRRGGELAGGETYVAPGGDELERIIAHLDAFYEPPGTTGEGVEEDPEESTAAE